MFKKSVKRGAAVLLTFVLLLTSLPLTAFAEVTTTSTETEDEYIYYSDLFYGYSYYLNDLELLSSHIEAQGAMNTAFNQYLDSPQFTWAAISKHISLTTSMSDLMIAYSDILGLTNVSYNDNLDEANKKFAQALFELKVGDIESISKDTKCMGQFKKIISTLQKVWKAIYDTHDIKTYDTFVDLAYADMKEYCTNLKPLFPHLTTGTYTAISELLDVADDTQEILDLFTAIIVSLGMEEIRLDVIKEIIETQKSDTILYEGMNRLYSQLEGGFVKYFIDTYFNDKTIEEVSKKTSKYITSQIMEKVANGLDVSSAETLTSVFGAVTASVGLLNTIVFEWILGDYIPSIEDYQVTMILSQYSDLMRDTVVSKQSIFQTQFTVDEIEKYETLMVAYAASMRCALDECTSLIVPINSSTEKELKSLYGLYGDSFYLDYIDTVKTFIKKIPVSERIITNFGRWNIKTNVELRAPSDTIEKDSIYCTKDGFNGELYPYDNVTLTVPKNEIFIVNNMSLSPSIGMNYTPAELVNYGVLNVSAHFSFGGNVYNHGELNVVGDLTGGGASGGRTRFYMSNPNAILRVGGDVYFYHKYDVGAFGVVKSIDFIASKITNGTVVFNGRGKQTVSGLSADTVIIDNTSSAGVEFATTTSIKTLFDHKGNNFNLTNQRLDSTFADYDGDGLKDNVDPYPTIHEKCPEGHNYGQWKIVRDATPSIIGIKYRECFGCGDRITETIPMVEKLAFKGASLTLHHNLAINYKVDKSLFDTVGYSNPYVVFEIGGKKTTVKAYAVEGDRYVFRFRNIAPNQMNDTIYATLYATYNGVEYASETKEYSVAEYCYSTLEKYATDDYAELRTLLVDLLNYGAQSQLYTKYNVDSLVNANLTEAQLAWGTAEDPTLTNSLNTAYETVENPLITWKGASLNLNDSVSMRFKFIAEDIDGLSLKITGETDEWNITSNNFVLEDGVYSVRFSGLNAGQMSEKVYLTMYKNGVAVSNTVCYSIESYAYSKQDSTIEHLSDLVKAMMKYGNSAHSYVN